MRNVIFLISIFTISLFLQACVKDNQQIRNESLTLRKVSVFNEKDIQLPKEKIKK